eukprot:6643891-Pyramimonas_sp.AAC.1
MAWSRRAGHLPESQAPRPVESLPAELQLKFKPIAASLLKPDGAQKVVEHLAILDGERPGDRERLSHVHASFDYMI